MQEKALKECEEHLKQYKDAERKLHRLSGNHAKKMAESADEIQSLKVIVSFQMHLTVHAFISLMYLLQNQLARKEQLTVQALDKKEEV